MSTGILFNRICLITGSSRGIGLGVARVFAENGASVILHGRDGNVLRKSSATLVDPVKHTYVAADLNTAQGPLNIAEGFLRLQKKLDVLIHSAGVLGPKVPLANYPEAAWNDVLRVNLTAPFLLTQALLPALRKDANPAVLVAGDELSGEVTR